MSSQRAADCVCRLRHGVVKEGRFESRFCFTRTNKHSDWRAFFAGGTKKRNGSEDVLSPLQLRHRIGFAGWTRRLVAPARHPCRVMIE
jgi:hypothetical protein